MGRTLPFVQVPIFAFLVSLLVLPASSQNMSRLDREHAETMLEVVTSDVRKMYYDPKLHGLDWQAKVRDAKAHIAQTTSFDEAYLQIAAVLEALDDSHTFFIPPRRSARVDYGWRWDMFGDRCYVTDVRPGSDAQAKGIRPGDELLTIEGYKPERESLWKISYALSLSPQSALEAVVREPSGKMRRIKVEAKITKTADVRDFDDMTGRDLWRTQLQREELRRLARVRYQELGDALMIVKVPDFSQPPLEIQEVMEKARKHKSLIIDLRDNPGGYEESLQAWLGCLFSSDVKIADRVGRDKTTPLMAQSNHHTVFGGKLFVLIDNGSASAAETLSRVVQIEKRGTLLGDRTSGMTMEAEISRGQTGINPVYTFGAMVTIAKLVMPDGKSLERVGVSPDEVVLPTAQDLANGSDPAMSRAAQLAGVTIDPHDAGKLFPHDWPRRPAYMF